MSLALLLGLLAVPASACDAWFQTLDVVSHPDDGVALPEPVLLDLSVRRDGAGLPWSDWGDSCPGTTGFLELHIGLAVDDLDDTGIGDGHLYSEPHPVGYRLRVVDGALPENLDMRLTDDVWWGKWSVSEGLLDMHLEAPWDDPPRKQRPFAATLEVVAVDLRGNESPLLLVEVQDDPGGCGCAAAPGPEHGWPLLIAALGLRRRRGRNRPEAGAHRIG